MLGLSKTWVLDPALQRDTFKVTSLSICDVRLMNDARWPWLILVPRIPDAVELFDLAGGPRETAMHEAAEAGQKLQAITSCEKINIAMIGNMVRQLHIHVIARASGDENWPGPVWGYGEAEPYDPPHAEALAAHLRSVL